jgi:hypothetical protein
MCNEDLVWVIFISDGKAYKELTCNNPDHWVPNQAVVDYTLSEDRASELVDEVNAELFAALFPENEK